LSGYFIDGVDDETRQVAESAFQEPFDGDRVAAAVDANARRLVCGS
jgi:uncharacterized membrane protein YebE (DUF533 family)